MASAQSAPAAPTASVEWWPALAGAFLAVALLKLGNPVILDHIAPPPATTQEILHDLWPANWGYILLAPVVLLGARRWQRPAAVPGWALALPLVWLGWQFISASNTVDEPLTRAVLPHFVATVACFGLGLAAGRSPGAGWLWPALLVGLLAVLILGFRQQYGGLAANREFFYENERTGWRNVPEETLRELAASRLILRTPEGGFHLNPDLLPKLAKDRVFSSLVTANTFAGVILLLLPGALATTWWLTSRLQNITRGVLVGLVAYMALACLYWSGSKAGWLIALVVAGVALLNLPWAKRLKVALVAGVASAGLAVFAWKYQAYFADGARSTVSRWSCWQVAARTAVRHPVLGTGPGTFYAVYRQAKPPDVEMSRLTHNDYLQQAADSGVVGGAAFGGFIIASLMALGRRTRNDWPRFAVWLGLLGWAGQSFVEFGLYVPALAWTAFLLLGWLWAAGPSRPVTS